VHLRVNHMGLVVNRWYCDRRHSGYFGFPLSITIPLTFIDLVIYRVTRRKDQILYA